MLTDGIPGMAVPKHIELSSHADIWLAETGDDAIYYNVKTGMSVLLAASLEQEVQAFDDMGRIVRHTVIYIRSDIVTPGVGDVITIDNQDYVVEELPGDEGYIATLYVSKA